MIDEATLNRIIKSLYEAREEITKVQSPAEVISIRIGLGVGEVFGATKDYSVTFRELPS